MAASDPTRIDQDVRAEAVAALTDALAWRLAPARWEQPVKRIVESMAAALAAGDSAALRQGTISLELEGARRLTDVGTTPTVPAPEPVRQRLAYLVHSLSGLGPATSGERAEESNLHGDDGGDPLPT